MKKYTPAILIFPCLFFLFTNCNQKKSNTKEYIVQDSIIVKKDSVKKKTVSSLDTIDYNKRMQALANKDTTGRWPVKAPYPLPGALLPYNRIIAYYGNLYSKRMGVLGEYPKDEMIEKLQAEVARWKAADSTVNTIPAFHYIAVSAQGAPGTANRYNMRMPFKQIDTLLNWAKPINALVFLDVQIGHSTVKEEVSQLVDYLALPNVHLGIDPEFSMKTGHTPGKKIGTMSADDINDAIDILAKIVREKKLAPKVLVVHRFTQGMVTNYKAIKTVPEVQIVMDMDGFGSQILKRSTYLRYIYREPVQFTGFKLFYKNDNWNDWKIYTPEQLLQFSPKPIYIQYQ
ncbi:putative Lipoprotein [Flavobacterium daejeonense]|nr:putative Lipoprotein [Flavobacterium daejeonense]